MSSANPPDVPAETPPSKPRPADGWPEVMTAAEAAAYLRVSPSTLRLSLLSGDVPGMRVGSNWRLLRSELDARMAAREPSPTIASRSRDRKGMKLGPRKKTPGSTETQPAGPSATPEAEPAAPPE